MQLLPAVFKGGSFLANVGTAIGAASSIASGLYGARVAKMNAQIAEQNAARARQETAVQSQMQDMEAIAQLGEIVSRTAASGLDIGVGSAALRRRSAEELAARDRGFTAYQGEREAAGYSQQASSFRAEARASRTSGFLGALGEAANFDFPNYVVDAPRVSARAMNKIRPRRNPVYTGAL